MQGHGPANWVRDFPIPFSNFTEHPGKFEHVNSGLIVTGIIIVFSILAARKIRGREEQFIVPPSRASFAGIADYFFEAVYGLVQSTLGPQTKKYFPFVGAMFIFILFSNLFGLIPYGGAPTSSLSTGFALGLTSFVFYNYQGIKEMGLGPYLNHFRMGIGGNFFFFVLGLVVACFELLSHILRPLTLGGRLGLNLTMDHMILHIFRNNLMAWLLPVPLMLFGIVVALIQAFVFATLTAVYLQLATEHHEEHHEGAHH